MSSDPKHDGVEKTSVPSQKDSDTTRTEDNEAFAYLADENDEGYYQSFREAERDQEGEFQASSNHQSRFDRTQEKKDIGYGLMAEAIVTGGDLLFFEVLNPQRMFSFGSDSETPDESLDKSLNKMLRMAKLVVEALQFNEHYGLREGKCRGAHSELIETVKASLLYFTGSAHEASSDVSQLSHILQDK